ncbi:hypothetical protein Avbf_05524 [Armadillidium vulgare]|nr:hypothetical protein Avbf_05524 [Armadillidium vulgare]
MIDVDKYRFIGRWILIAPTKTLWLRLHPKSLESGFTISKTNAAAPFLVSQSFQSYANAQHVEVLNPRPHVKKVTETRYTTIRYPVFITQVIKPLLTQIETKVKPVFFTKTIDKYTTVLFTVTGIGQVTVTTVKYEKEYITRCMKKGYYHRSFSDEEGPEVKEGDIHLPLEVTEVVDAKVTEVIPPSPHIPPIIPPSEPTIVYKSGPHPEGQRDGPIKRLSETRSKDGGEQLPRRRFRKRRPNRKSPNNIPILPPNGPSSPLIRPPRRGINRSGKPAELGQFSGEIGNVHDLYSGDIYYSLDDTKRRAKNLETSYIVEIADFDPISEKPHPPLSQTPLNLGWTSERGRIFSKDSREKELFLDDR